MRVIAKLEVNNWNSLTPARRWKLINWMLQQANVLADKKLEIADKYTAKYITRSAPQPKRATHARNHNAAR